MHSLISAECAKACNLNSFFIPPAGKTVLKVSPTPADGQGQQVRKQFRNMTRLTFSPKRSGWVWVPGRPVWFRYAAAFVCLLAPALPQLSAQQTNSPAPDSTTGDHATAYKKLSLEELMNLDVTSVAKQPEHYGEAPAAIQVVTQNDIESSGASSIPEALRLADNLEVAQKNSHDWAISARGFNTALANKLLVLDDGRTVYTPLFSGVFWDVQDYLLQDIDRIEVVSGPGGTLWGANAVNGVINITSKSAKDTQGLYLETGGGTELQEFGAVRYGETIASNVYLRVYAKYFDRSSEELANGSPAGDAWDQGRVGFRLDSEAVPQNTLTVQGDYYGGDEDLSTGGMAKVGGGNLLGRWSRTFSPDSDVSLQMYFDRTYLNDPIPKSTDAFAPTGDLVDALNTYDVDFQYHLHLLSWNNIVMGTGYRYTHDNVGNSPNLEFLPAHYDESLYNAFLQDEIRLCENLHLTLGSKIDHNDYTGFEYEPSGRLQLNLASDQMVWGAVSRAVRTPSRVDEDEFVPTYLPKALPQYVIAGGSNFVSETLIAYELGYRGQLGPKVSTSVSTFYNVYNDVRSLAPTTSLLVPFVFENNLEGETYGFELTGDYQVLDWWRLHAGYDYLKEYLHVRQGQVDLNNALNETSDPQNQVALRSSMDLPFRLELDNGVRWVDTLHINNGAAVGTVPSYFELNSRLAWHATQHIEFALVGENLLQGRHPEYGFPGPGRVEIARSVFLKASYSW
jgi:iron complex outermembrane recepter protein